MKIQAKHFTTYLMFAIIMLLLSCTKNNNIKKEILNYKDTEVSYQVFEQLSKVNSDDIDQCENFLEYSSSNTSFELYGASIADVYSNLYDVDRSNVKLEDKKAIFYSINYNGIKNDSIIKDMVDKLLKSRNLKVTTTSQVVTVYYLPENTHQVLEKYTSVNAAEETSVSFSNNEIELKNGTLAMLIGTLNEHYPNTFACNDKSTRKFNLTIPVLQTANETINYIKANYGISFTTENKRIQQYIISVKKAK